MDAKKTAYRLVKKKKKNFPSLNMSNLGSILAR